MTQLSAEEHALVARAQELGLCSASEAPGFLSPGLCTTLSLLLALPTFGYSLIMVPLIWYAQHERASARIAQLRRLLGEAQGSALSGCV